VPDFSLLLFSIDEAFVRAAVRAGVTGIMVDWERDGKCRRQANADTEINTHTLDDLRRVRRATDARVICRVNQPGCSSAAEIESAIDAGADELLVPMVRRCADVEQVLERVRGRCRVGILVETADAVACARDLCALPLSRIYVGLNDLAIDRGADCIFESVADGTVDAVRQACPLPFGFGGLTLPDAGSPIPCRLLIAEMARLGAGFSFLRRSFHRDIRGRDVAVEIPVLLAALDAARRRSASEVARDRAGFQAAVAACRQQAVNGARAVGT
jgi:hypothetical protein